MQLLFRPLLWKQNIFMDHLAWTFTCLEYMDPFVGVLALDITAAGYKCSSPWIPQTICSFFHSLWMLFLILTRPDSLYLFWHCGGHVSLFQQIPFTIYTCHCLRLVARNFFRGFFWGGGCGSDMVVEKGVLGRAFPISPCCLLCSSPSHAGGRRAEAEHSSVHTAMQDLHASAGLGSRKMVSPSLPDSWKT